MWLINSQGIVERSPTHPALAALDTTDTPRLLRCAAAGTLTREPRPGWSSMVKLCPGCTYALTTTRCAAVGWRTGAAKPFPCRPRMQ